MLMVNLKHTVIRFFNTLLHLTLMFCVIWFLMFTPYLIIKILFNITYDFNIRLLINLFGVIILYNFIYKKNTLKVHIGLLILILFMTFLSVIWYNVFLAYLIIYFTNNYELSHYSNFIYQIFLPFPLLLYITAFKNKRWFKILTWTITTLTILTILSVIVATPGGLKWLICLLFAPYLL